MRRFPWQNAVYFVLYTSGLYGLVLWPPVTKIVSILVDPLRRAIEHDVTQVPLPIRCVAAFLLFDCAAYWLHRAAHASRILWLFHRVHHSDPHLGLLTTFRFHFIEIAWRMAIQFAPLYVLSIAASLPTALLLAFIAFNVLAHSALAWSYGPADRIVVSPAYHAVHHNENDRANYGMFLTIWDAMFATAQRGQSQPNTPAVSSA